MVTSVHGSQNDSAQVKKSPERKAKRETAEIEGKMAVMEAERRKQESGEWQKQPAEQTNIYYGHYNFQIASENPSIQTRL